MTPHPAAVALAKKNIARRARSPLTNPAQPCPHAIPCCLIDPDSSIGATCRSSIRSGSTSSRHDRGPANCRIVEHRRGAEACSGSGGSSFYHCDGRRSGTGPRADQEKAPVFQHS
jgi:hypothetical protein